MERVSIARVRVKPVWANSACTSASVRKRLAKTMSINMSYNFPNDAAGEIVGIADGEALVGGEITHGLLEHGERGGILRKIVVDVRPNNRLKRARAGADAMHEMWPRRAIPLPAYQHDEVADRLRRIGLQQGAQRGAGELPRRGFSKQAQVDQHVHEAG